MWAMYVTQVYAHLANSSLFTEDIFEMIIINVNKYS